jgi:hypothetical protein
MERLDFRFAVDEGDAADINKLINDCYFAECDGSVTSFRKPGPRVSIEEVSGKS